MARFFGPPGMITPFIIQPQLFILTFEDRVATGKVRCKIRNEVDEADMHILAEKERSFEFRIDPSC